MKYTNLQEINKNREQFLLQKDKDQQTILGQLVYPKVKSFLSVSNLFDQSELDDNSSKITDMLIDYTVFEFDDIIDMLKDDEEFKERIEEAIGLIKNQFHQQTKNLQSVYQEQFNTLQEINKFKDYFKMQTLENQKLLLGKIIYPKVQNFLINTQCSKIEFQTYSIRITVMLIEFRAFETKDFIDILLNEYEFQKRVQEAIDIIKRYNSYKLSSNKQFNSLEQIKKNFNQFLWCQEIFQQMTLAKLIYPKVEAQIQQNFPQQTDVFNHIHKIVNMILNLKIQKIEDINNLLENEYYLKENIQQAIIDLNKQNSQNYIQYDNLQSIIQNNNANLQKNNNSTYREQQSNYPSKLYNNYYNNNQILNKSSYQYYQNSQDLYTNQNQNNQLRINTSKNFPTLQQIQTQNKQSYITIPQPIKYNNRPTTTTYQPQQVSLQFNTLQEIKNKRETFVQLIEEEQKLVFGSLIYPKVLNHLNLTNQNQTEVNNFTPKITSMLMDFSVFEIDDIIEMLEKEDQLKEFIEEAFGIIKNQNLN